MPASIHVLLRIYGFAASKESAVAAAIADLLEGEGLAGAVFGPVETDPAGLAWASDPRAPFPVANAAKWSSAFDKAVARAVRTSGGARAVAEVLTVEGDQLKESGDLRLAMRSIVQAVRPAPKRTAKKKAAKKKLAER